MSESRTDTRVERDEDAKHEPLANKPPAQPDLKILESQVLRGPNFWSYEPAIRLLVDLGSLEHWPSNTLPAFTDALVDLLPGLHDHGCSLHRPGGFIERLREGTWMGHVAEHVALELQREAGGSTTRGKTRRARQHGAGRRPISVGAQRFDARLPVELAVHERDDREARDQSRWSRKIRASSKSI